MCTSIASSRGAISDDVRQRSHVGDVEDAVVRRAVVADQAGAVHREDDVELSAGRRRGRSGRRALQERRVDRRDRLDALERQAGGEEDRLLLGDADVEVAVGKPFCRMFRPVPVFIAAVMPTMRRSRRHSVTSASPKTAVYCGGGSGAGPPAPAPRRARRDRHGLGGMPALHALQAALLGGREALALDRRDVHDDRRVGGERAAQRARSARTSWPSMTPVYAQSSSSHNRPEPRTP